MDMDGIPIKELKADTRYTRFAQRSAHLYHQISLQQHYNLRSTFVLFTMVSELLNSRSMLYSLQLSIDGKNLAQDEPYLIWNGRNRELVIHTPEQVREFYRKDGKGQQAFRWVTSTLPIAACF